MDALPTKNCGTQASVMKIWNQLEIILYNYFSHLFFFPIFSVHVKTILSRSICFTADELIRLNCINLQWGKKSAKDIRPRMYMSIDCYSSEKREYSPLLKDNKVVAHDNFVMLIQEKLTFCFQMISLLIHSTLEPHTSWCTNHCHRKLSLWIPSLDLVDQRIPVSHCLSYGALCSHV